MMLAITGLAILHRSERGRNEKREEQRKRGRGDRLLADCFILLALFYPCLFLPDSVRRKPFSLTR